MFIYILRHAWAGEHGDPNFPDDSLRPLTPDGKKRFADVAKELVRRDCRPEVVATSPLVRCRQTADILAEHLPGNTPVVELDLLAPGADLTALLEWTSQQAAQQVAWVGHAPDVGQLAAALIGDGEAELRFAKGACCAIRLDGGLHPGGGELYWHVTAKILGC